MRVIAGIAGGLRLKAPPGSSVRPTSDRAKEAVFASLGDLRGWTVVDLFAGSGALGLEALSRGASRVRFVEKNVRHLRCLQENLACVVHAMAATTRADTGVLRGDATQVAELLPEFSGAVELILADPPYAPAPGERGAADLLTSAELVEWAGSALLVLEHAPRTPLPWAPASRWGLLRQRRYGTQMFSYARVQALTPA